MNRPTRVVTFLVSSTVDGKDELHSALGAAADAGTLAFSERHGSTAWEVTHEGSGEVDLSQLAGDVMKVVRELRVPITSACARPGNSCLLRIVQYVGDDPVGPGFALPAADVKLLAELGAFLDVDQYLG